MPAEHALHPEVSQGKETSDKLPLSQWVSLDLRQCRTEESEERAYDAGACKCQQELPFPPLFGLLPAPSLCKWSPVLPAQFLPLPSPHGSLLVLLSVGGWLQQKATDMTSVDGGGSNMAAGGTNSALPEDCHLQQ